MILYYIEEKIDIGSITQCHIFKFNDRFELIYKFLDDVITKSPSSFNRVFINAKGIYYLEKNYTIDNVKQIVVKHIQFDNNRTGFEELK